jgi:hypothetical protein
MNTQEEFDEAMKLWVLNIGDNFVSYINDMKNDVDKILALKTDKNTKKFKLFRVCENVIANYAYIKRLISESHFFKAKTTVANDAALNTLFWYSTDYRTEELNKINIAKASVVKYKNFFNKLASEMLLNVKHSRACYDASDYSIDDNDEED